MDDGQPPELGPVDVAHPEGDLLGAGDHQALPVLDGLDEVGRLEEGFVRPGVEPGDAPAHELDPQLAPLQVFAVEVGDLDLAPGRGLEAGGDVRDPAVVEIEAGHGVVRFRLFGLLLDVRPRAGPCRSRRRRSAPGSLTA